MLINPGRAGLVREGKRGIRREPHAPASCPIIHTRAANAPRHPPPGYRDSRACAPLRTMKAGFYTIMAAQFFSSLADNALLIAAIQLLRDLKAPAWMTPSLKQCFVISYVLLAPLVGAFADSMPKGRVMLITNAVKIVGCVLMLFSVHPLAGLRDRRPRRRGVLAGQVRHPDRAAAAAAARGRQRLDRGHDGRLDHPRRRAGSACSSADPCRACCSRSTSRISTPGSTRRRRPRSR